MITTFLWSQHAKVAGALNLDTMICINPSPRFYIITVERWHLCHLNTDGTDEEGDLANAMTLCRLHYQHSFSGEPNEKTT